MITVVLLWNRFPPSRLVPVQKCLQFIENMLCVKNNHTAVLVLLGQPAVFLYWKKEVSYFALQNGRKYVVSQNIMVTPVLLVDPFFSPLIHPIYNCNNV